MTGALGEQSPDVVGVQAPAEQVAFIDHAGEQLALANFMARP
jgi:hypothetical protein